MPDDTGFYTLAGYARNGTPLLTAAMEDYLEMIVRLAQEDQPLRINALAKQLHVKPSSASKMAVHLKERGLVAFEKYGELHLTDAGREHGAYLMRRHEAVNRLLCAINGTDDELTQAEKIEHFLDRRTVDNIPRFLEQHKPEDA